MVMGGRVLGMSGFELVLVGKGMPKVFDFYCKKKDLEAIRSRSVQGPFMLRELIILKK